MESLNQKKLPDIIRTVEINANIEEVWQAVSTSDGLANWLMPNNFQPIEGSDFYLQTHFGQVPCKVTEIQKPNRISFNWDDFGWVVTFELKEMNSKTQFTVIHAGWGEPDEIIPRTQQKQAVVRDIMYEGWGHNTEKIRDKLDKEKK